MKYFKSPSGEVFAYESDGSQDAWIAPDLTLMTPEEVDAHLNQPSPQPATSMSTLTYFERFTDAEYAAVRQGPIALQRGLDSMIAAQFVDVTDPRVTTYLDALVTTGIITDARKAELLAPPA